MSTVVDSATLMFTGQKPKKTKGCPEALTRYSLKPRQLNASGVIRCKKNPSPWKLSCIRLKH